MTESAYIVDLSQYQKSAVEPDAGDSRYELGIGSSVVLFQQLDVHFLDLCLDVLEAAQARRHSGDVQRAHPADASLGEWCLEVLRTTDSSSEDLSVYLVLEPGCLPDEICALSHELPEIAHIS